MRAKIVLFAFGFFLAFWPVGPAFAQEDLPSAGLTPESPFYFLDRLGEALREFFTFNPEGKARLQITFVAERVAEIKVILETKGVGARGLEVAKARLEASAAKAVNIVEQEKQKGKNVSKLAGEIVDNFHLQKKAAKEAFEAAKEKFFIKKRELHNQFLAAIEAGDTALQEQIRAELAAIEAAKDEAEAKKDATIAALEAEKDRLEDELEEQKRQEDEARDVLERAEEEERKAEEKRRERQEEAEDAIKEAEAEKQEVLNEAKEEGVELPPAVFVKFERLLAQAKELLARENYQGAKQLAEQAEDALEEVDKEIEKLEKEKEKKEEEAREEEERREEQAEKQREAEERLRELEEKSEAREEERTKTAPRTHRVEIGAEGFGPPELKIKKGDTVVWTNVFSREVWPASAVHPTHRELPGFDALHGLSQGESYRFRFDKPGSWRYHDHLNPANTGAVHVSE